ncbi:uncharacterized protein MKK02DRAFT_29152 [Dioszegia hungarica]|uniref:Chromo domain-containing protein n=1 Tax=Dioszegia hungarica TaxID=4972 RepID=A0AA38H3V4_9TREE|nr:uncharacterized protein MKK02DRAFT_29152 [Dioszegia hungarica]KAI9633292.1 hypothetical protein MKK02DRAFT_29152 [Dioszegia hungarica]
MSVEASASEPGEELLCIAEIHRVWSFTSGHSSTGGRCRARWENHIYHYQVPASSAQPWNPSSGGRWSYSDHIALQLASDEPVPWHCFERCFNWRSEKNHTRQITSGDYEDHIFFRSETVAHATDDMITPTMDGMNSHYEEVAELQMQAAADILENERAKMEAARRRRAEDPLQARRPRQMIAVFGTATPVESRNVNAEAEAEPARSAISATVHQAIKQEIGSDDQRQAGLSSAAAAVTDIPVLQIKQIKQEEGSEGAPVQNGGRLQAGPPSAPAAGTGNGAEHAVSQRPAPEVTEIERAVFRPGREIPAPDVFGFVPRKTDEGECDVEAILDSRWEGEGWDRRLQYLVLWAKHEGTGGAEQWVDSADATGARPMIARFHAERPHKPRPEEHAGGEQDEGGEEREQPPRKKTKKKKAGRR